jgi:hypothetical protein
MSSSGGSGRSRSADEPAAASASAMPAMSGHRVRQIQPQPLVAGRRGGRPIPSRRVACCRSCCGKDDGFGRSVAEWGRDQGTALVPPIDFCPPALSTSISEGDLLVQISEVAL